MVTIVTREDVAPEDLVPGRRCGECTVCCIVPAINDVALKKPSGAVCPNCLERAGCRIYETRPGNCRAFYCGWMTYEALDDSWRPDLCGVLLLTEENDIPSHYMARHGVNFLVFGPWRAVLQAGFVEYIGALVERDIPAFLSIPGPEGFHPAKSLLNEALRGPVAAGDRQAMTDRLIDALELLAKYEFVPNAF